MRFWDSGSEPSPKTETEKGHCRESANGREKPDVYKRQVQILYRIFYKKASLLLLNNMCMLLSVGFIMLCRLDIATATKQLVIAAAASGIALIIPVMIRCV